MKIIVKFVLCLVFPFSASAQPDAEVNSLVGLWKGHIKSSERRLPYELVISYKDGKFSGYSYTTFGVKDDVATMKKINVSFENGRIVVADEDVLYNNIKKDAARAIKQINTLSMDGNKLAGDFETKAPPGFKTARGSVSLEKQQTKEDSKSMAKLEEMGLSKDLSFNLDQPSLTAKIISDKDLAVVKTNQPSSDSVSITGIDTDLAKRDEAALAKAVAVAEKPAPAPKTDSVIIAKAEIKPVKEHSVSTPVPAKPKPAAPVVKDKPAAPVVVSAKPPAPKSPAPKPSAAKPTTAPVASAKPPLTQPAVAKPKVMVPANVSVGPSVDLSKRKIETIDELMVASDSIKLTLYDNGEVDGDTVSIILNGNTIVSRQGLTARAYSKTIYLTPDMGDSVQLVMYAENLGALPPNSGLLVVDYDKRRKEIRFSGDLNKNAAITLKRKKEQ